MSKNTKSSKKNHTIHYIIASCVIALILVVIYGFSEFNGNKKDQQGEKTAPTYNPESCAKYNLKCCSTYNLESYPKPANSKQLKVDETALSAIQESLNERIEPKNLTTFAKNSLWSFTFWHTREKVLNQHRTINLLYDVWNWSVVIIPLAGVVPLLGLTKLADYILSKIQYSTYGIPISFLAFFQPILDSIEDNKIKIACIIIAYLCLVIVHLFIYHRLDKYPIYHPAYSTYSNPSNPITKEYTAEDLAQAQEQQKKLEQQMSEVKKELKDVKKKLKDMGSWEEGGYKKPLSDLEKEHDSKKKEHKEAKNPKRKKHLEEEIDELELKMRHIKSEKKHRKNKLYLEIIKNKLELLKQYISLQQEASN